jgi:vacuolar-type H+-ATPase subunit C/Vma6
MTPTGLEAVSYAAANAQVSGLRARLLGDEAWERLVGAASVAETLSLLRDSMYSEAIPQAENKPPDLEAIERGLLGLTADHCRHTMTFIRGPARDMLQVWWGHFELENLKAVLRGVDQGLEPERIRTFLIPLGERSNLPWDLLLHERSIPGLVERLDGTHYVNPARNALHLYTQYSSLFPIEVALDVRYYRDIVAATKRLGATDRAAAVRLLGTYLDILNILWAYRYRVYYGLSAEEIVNFTLWHTVHTDVSLIQTIAMGAQPDEIVRRIWSDDRVNLDPLSEVSSDAEMVPVLEMILLRFWSSLAQAAFQGYRFSLGTVLAYVILQELEVRDLVTVMEAKSLGWNEEQIRARLIHTASQP